jgi:hypothetical protein
MVQAPEKIGRNDPCHCGSGVKYKKCHLDSDHEAAKPPPPPELDLADSQVRAALWRMDQLQAELAERDLLPDAAVLDEISAEVPGGIQTPAGEWPSAVVDLWEKFTVRRVPELLQALLPQSAGRRM